MSPLTKKGATIKRAMVKEFNHGFGGASVHSLRGNGFHHGSLDIAIEDCFGSYSNG